MISETAKPDSTPKAADLPPAASRIAGLLPTWVVNLWLAFVLAWFFVVRILGSGMGQHVLSVLGLHHPR
jgi:hypothetical protein